MQNYNKIIKKELNRILPYHLLGVLLHAIVFYLTLKIPESIGKILDMLMQTNIDKAAIMQEAYRLIFYSSIVFVPRTSYRTLLFTISRKTDTYLRKKVIEHLQKVKPEYYDKENKGTFLAYMTKEIMLIHKVLGNFWFWIGKMCIAPIMAIILIWNQFNKSLAILLIPMFPIAIIAMYHYYKKLREEIEISRKVYIELSKNIEQNTDGFLLIKSYNQQKAQIDKFKEINNKMYQADYNIGAAKNKISDVINILYGACYIIGFAMGIIYIQKGMMTIGELTALIGYIGFALSDFISAIEKFFERIAYFKQSINRFNYFLNLDEYKKEGTTLQKIEKIEIQHLSYWYNSDEIPALDNINMVIEKGQKIGIVGQVGSGKTTLMNIITGFYEIPDGMVLINGEDINKYGKDEIFQKINYAVQANIILDDTIKSNINIAENLEENEFQDIINKSQLQEDIQSFQEKENTFVGEKGIKLSGGQKQRISIARNLSNIRDINIFDDTLSALDSNTEKIILDNLIHDIGDNTLIVISNKISNVKDLDKIYILLEGKIQDCGTHQELLERNKFYQELNTLERKEDENERYFKEKC